MVRNAIVHHNANVKLLGVKGSSGFRFLGFSHNLTSDTEDVDACKNLNLACSIPSVDEVRDVILSSYQEQKARYIRL